MQQAGLDLSSSPSSTLADCFLVVTGVYDVVTQGPTQGLRKAGLVSKYSAKVKKYAKSIESWKPFANGLSASIGESGRVSVNFSGSNSEKEAVHLLEYGTPGTPPQSVIRIMEEELSQDYFQDIQGLLK
jgi:hypothetical protein